MRLTLRPSINKRLIAPGDAASAASSDSLITKPDPLPITRWVLLILLLFLEILGLSVLFDPGVRSGDTNWPGVLLYLSPRFLRSIIDVVVLVAALGLWRLRDELRADQSGRAAALWALAHVAALGLFVVATGLVLSRGRNEVRPVDFGLWAAAAVVAFLLWAAAAVGPRRWPRLARRGWPWVLAAAATGLATSMLGAIAQRGWDVLSEPTLRASHFLLGLVSDDAYVDFETRRLGTSGFRVWLAPACAGYQGMALVAVYMAGYLWLSRRTLRFPRAILLLPVGVAAMWAANVFRIVALILVGDRGSPALAMGGLHTHAGWLTFNAVAVGLTLVAHRSRVFSRTPDDAAVRVKPTAAYLSPLLATVAIQMVGEALAADAAVLYPLRVAVVATLLWAFRKQYELRGFDRLAGGAFGAVAAGTLVFVAYVNLNPAAAVNEIGIRPAAAGTIVAWATVRAIGYVIVTPIAEELAFRGYLLRRLVAADFDRVALSTFTWLSFLVSSALFGLVHGDVLAGTVAGMGYALVAYATGRLWPAVLAHAVTNALLFAAGLSVLS